MKRHPGLRGLSSDHQQGLVHARRLVIAAADMKQRPDSNGSAAHRETARSFLFLWAQHTNHHFRQEEEVLLPAFARYGDPDQPPIVRMLVEHVQIRRLVGDLEQQLSAQEGMPSPDTMHALGTLLYNHIRHEENVVFPIMESVIPSEILSELPEELSIFSGLAES